MQHSMSSTESNHILILYSYNTRYKNTITETLKQFEDLSISLLDLRRPDRNDRFIISRRNAIVLLTPDALLDNEFMQFWAELVRSDYDQFILSIDSVETSSLPKIFDGLSIYSVDDENIIVATAEAVKNGNKLLEKFISTTIKTTPASEYEQLASKKTFSVQLLRRAWVRIKKYASINDAYFDEVAFQRFEENLDSNLVVLAHFLNTRPQEYRLQHLIRVSVEKSKDMPDDKRYLYQAQPETALVLQAICDLISPTLEAKSIAQSYGNRITAQSQEDIFQDYWTLYQSFQRDVLSFARENEEYYYHRVDVRRYYPRIDLTVLFQMLQEDIQDSILLQFLYQMLFDLESLIESGETERATERGLPAGLPICHVLANYHFHKIDTIMKELTRIDENSYAYYRYVDDIVFFGQSQNDVENQRRDLEKHLVDFLHLPEGERTPLHPEKSTKLPTSAGDASNLRSHLQGISGQIEQSYLPWLSPTEQLEIADSIYTLLFEVEDNPKLTDELANYTPRGIKRLRELDYDPAAIKDLIYSLLRKISLRVNNIRYLVAMLTDLFWSESEATFRDFVSQANPIVQLGFLKSIQQYPLDRVDPQLLRMSVDFLRSDNQLVVRETAITLSQMIFTGLNPVFVSPEKIESALIQNSSFSRAYLFELGIYAYREHFLQMTGELISESATCMNSVLVMLSEFTELNRQVNHHNIEPFAYSEIIIRFLDLLYALDLNAETE